MEVSISSIPYIGAVIGFLPFNLIYRRKPPYLQGVFKYLSLGAVVLGIGIIVSQKDNADIVIREPDYLLEVVREQAPEKGENYLIFTSYNCPYCVKMRTNYRKIANYHKGTSVNYIDLTDQAFKANPEIMKKLETLKITKLPTIVKMKDGKLVKSHKGTQTMKELEIFFGRE